MRHVDENRDILGKVKNFIEKRSWCTSLLWCFGGILAVDKGLLSDDRFPLYCLKTFEKLVSEFL